MITTVISAKGVVRTGQLSRVEEYIFILEWGGSCVCSSIYNMLDDEVKKESDRSIEWLGFRRRAPQAKRNSRPNQFYPIYVNNVDGKIASIGDVVQHGIDRNSIFVPDGCTALWPLSKDGDERLWSLVPEQARLNFEKGYLKVNNWNSANKSGTVYYLPSGTIKDIENGKATIVGYNTDGSVEAKYHSEGTTPPKRVWNMKTHNAETYGTNILNAIIGKRFDYPKSLYAVHDVIRFFVANKPNAIIVDFFSGSGTTLHAVNLLNAEDGGHRRCIMVTNNEVSADEAKMLKDKGYQPGDAEWEKLGIAHYVTWPRTVCSIEGHDVNGNPLKGDYLGSEPPMHMADGFKANAAFFKLGFLDPTAVSLGMRISEMLPTLWLKTGAKGKCPELTGEQVPDMLILPENQFAVLINESTFADFAEKLAEHPEIQTVFLATDYEVNYQSMVKNLNVTEVYQLYRDYLDYFRVNRGRN